MPRIIFSSEYMKSMSKGAVKNFVEYIATREGVEKLRENFVGYMGNRPGSHGLFGSDERIDLKAAQNEISDHKGTLWRHVVSLRREDAERLGFNNTAAWRETVLGQIPAIAESMKIPLNDLRWYATFHNESHHPHIHLLVYSNNPKHGFLTEPGIEKMRSAFANEIFKQDLVQLYAGKTEVRDELISTARNQMEKLMDDIKYNYEASPQLENKIAELSGRLSFHKSRKVYGYLKADDKKLVDDIVKELANDERIGALYKEWCKLQDDILSTYKDKLPEHPPLWEQEAFKSIKNAIINEVTTHYDGGMFVDVPGTEPDELSEPELPTGEQSDDYLIEWSAEYKLAQNYLYGRNNYEQDIEKALEIFSAEADRGNALALFEIGRMYQQGLLGDENTGESHSYFKKALTGFLSAEATADKEWLQSYLCYRIGKMHHMGLGAEQDYSAAAMWYKDAGDNKFAQYSLGSLYYYGDGVEQDYAEALRLYELAAEQGNAYAMYECGRMYGAGVGCGIDLTTSDFYYRKAFAAFEIIVKDRADDKLWYRLGQMCLKGIGTDIDIIKAREYFEKSAAVGNCYAQYALGKLYLENEQFEFAEKYLLMAAEQGEQHAQYKHGRLYINENTPLYDTNESIRWFTESATQGNQFAQYSLGKLLYDSDTAKAVEWLTASAEQGNQYAQYSLGKHYYYERDMEQAISWFTLSAAQGNECAAKMLDFIINGGQSHANASAITLLYHLSRMLRDSYDKNNQSIFGQTEKKLLRKIAQKKEAMGQRME